MARKRQKSKTSVLDVVVTCGGRFDMLRKCLQALQEQKDAPPFNVYLIDVNSPNDERLCNKDIFENPIITDSKRLTSDVGFPAFANVGARMGHSPLITFLSDDVELEPDVIKKIVDTFKDTNIGVVGIKLLFPKDSQVQGRPAGKVQHVGHGLDIHGNMQHPLMGWSADHPKCCISREVVSVTGACYSIRRDLFNKAGGFFEGYGRGTFEDTDLSLAAQELGKKVFVNCEAVGYHYVGATAEKKQVGFPLQQNSMIFKARWAQSPLFVWDDYKFY